ncbi:hypothetical protein ABJI51_26700 [Amycolatopsis sp. NEAU-NG30]|uniref:Flagellar basal body-associated protein FliL n=1 Tax=Amycolatopsis melonis TaxID=3156488 RepID=A0ABV0LGG1_9PSEU
MSWQEELRRLDEELAAGQLSADEYRARRDQVLSSAVGVQDQQPQQPASNADATQVIAPVSPPGGTPQPTPQPGDAERTQAVSWQAQQGRPGDPNATAYVPPVQAQPFSPPGGFAPPQPGADDNPERTQVVRNTGDFQPNYQGYSQQPPAQPGWNQVPPAAAAPPWGADDTGSAHNPNDLSWMRQGPESYFETKSGSGKKKVLSIVAAVVVVLLAGFAIWWFGLRGDSTQTAGPTNAPTSAAPSTTPPPPSVAPTRVPPMPGKASDKNGTMSVDDAVQKEFLNAAEASSIKAAGSAYVTCQASSNTPFDYTVLLVNTKSVADANRLAQTLQRPAASTGLQTVSDHAGLPQSVAVFKAVLPDHTTYRAVYVSGAAVIRVDVNQAPATDTAVTKEFQGVMKAMLENVPNS